MIIRKIKMDKPIKESIKHGNNYKIWLNPNMPIEAVGEGRKFSIKKLKSTEAK